MKRIKRHQEMVAAIQASLAHKARWGTFKSVPKIGFPVPPFTTKDEQKLHAIREGVKACSLCPLARERVARAKEGATNALQALGKNLPALINTMEQRGEDPSVLYERFARPVPGSGPANARLMVVGEAPGRNEEVGNEFTWAQQVAPDRDPRIFPADGLFGVPFVGRSGALFDEMLEFAGLRRRDVFVTNALRCRPPENRDPLPEELRRCATTPIGNGGAWLRRQIAIVRPWLIIVMGGFAAEAVLGYRHPINKFRGKLFTYPHAERLGLDIRVAVTFHPAALLRQPAMMRSIADDDWAWYRAVMQQAFDRFGA